MLLTAAEPTSACQQQETRLMENCRGWRDVMLSGDIGAEEDFITRLMERQGLQWRRGER